MCNVLNYRMLPNECVSLNISFVQHVFNVSLSVYGNYKALRMEIYKNVRTIIISLKTRRTLHLCCSCSCYCLILFSIFHVKIRYIYEPES